MGTICVDPVALRMAAQRFDTAADLLGGILATHLRDLGTGDAVVSELVAGFGRWAGAVREMAAALRLGADRYVEGESAAVAALQ